MSREEALALVRQLVDAAARRDISQVRDLYAGQAIAVKTLHLDDRDAPVSC